MAEDHSTEYLEAKKRYADMVKDLEEYEGWTDEINAIMKLLESGVRFLDRKLDEEEKEELNEEKSYCEEERAELERAICEKYGVETPAELQRKIQELEPEVYRLRQLVQIERRQRWKENPPTRRQGKRGKPPRRKAQKTPRLPK